MALTQSLLARKLPIERYMNKRYWLLFPILLLIVSSCKAPKEFTAAKPSKISKEYILGQLEKNKLQYEWLAAKARVSYSDKNRSKNFTANIRIRRDSVIWASITTMMGVEAAKLLITKDSAYIVDRFAKKYYARSIDFIETYIPFNFDIGLLQDLLLGNPLIMHDSKLKLKSDSKEYILQAESKKLKNLIRILPDSYLISTEHLTDKQANRKLSLIFDSYKSVDVVLFSFERKISFTDQDKIDIGLKFSRLKWDEPQSFPFNVNKKYERL